MEPFQSCVIWCVVHTFNSCKDICLLVAENWSTMVGMVRNNNVNSGEIENGNVFYRLFQVEVLRDWVLKDTFEQSTVMQKHWPLATPTVHLFQQIVIIIVCKVKELSQGSYFAITKVCDILMFLPSVVYFHERFK